MPVDRTVVGRDVNGNAKYFQTVLDVADDAAALTAANDPGFTGLTKSVFQNPNNVAEAGGFALESSLSAATADIAQLVDEVADSTNSRASASLANGAAFNGGFVELAGYTGISVSVLTDQDSAASGLVISWSDDGTNTIATQSFTVTAASDFSEVFPRRARYYKLNYTNGGTTATVAIVVRKLPRFASNGTTNVPVVASLTTGTASIGTVVTKPTGAPSYANGQVAASTTAATLLAARATRRRVLIKNTDGSIVVYIGAATVSAANGYPLVAGAEVELYSTTLIQVIAASGTPSVAYWEEYD